MNDLEITRLCAEAYFDTGQRMISTICDVAYVELFCEVDGIRYDPLHDDEQAMALVKKMRLDITAPLEKAPHKIWAASYGVMHRTPSNDLNRAICECVAKMQAAK